jgi:hypothetical protein
VVYLDVLLGLVGVIAYLESEDLGLDEVERLAVDLDEALAFLYGC